MPKGIRKAALSTAEKSRLENLEASLKSLYVRFSKTPPPTPEGDNAPTLEALHEQVSAIKSDFSKIRDLIGEIETRQAVLEAELSALQSMVTQASAAQQTPLTS